jgi:hypothetical protein
VFRPATAARLGSACTSRRAPCSTLTASEKLRIGVVQAAF